MAAGEANVRLDQLFPGVEVVLLLARENLAELGTDAADVGGQRLDGGEEEDEEDDGEGHGLDTRLRACDFPSNLAVLKGLDFSRAATPATRTSGFSPLGIVFPAKELPSAAKAGAFFGVFAARLKPCPFKALT